MTAAALTAMPTPDRRDAWDKDAWPLGAHYDAQTSSTTFAVAAPEATRVLLELYAAPTGRDALTDVDLVRDAAE